MARSGSQSRVSWTMRSPVSSARAWRRDLVLERVAHVPERVHVLDLDLGAVLAWPRGRSEMLASQRSEPSSMLPSHTPQVDQDRAERRQVGGRLLRAAEVRLGDDLHQRHAGPVEVHLARGRGLERALVDELAHVLLEVHALDADLARGRRPRSTVEAAVLGERLLVLADLVVLRHVRVVVVLAREAVQARSPRSRAPARSSMPNSMARRLITGSEPGMPRQTGQVWVFGAAPKVGRAAAEHLGARQRAARGPRGR